MVGSIRSRSLTLSWLAIVGVGLACGDAPGDADETGLGPSTGVTGDASRDASDSESGESSETTGETVTDTDTSMTTDADTSTTSTTTETGEDTTDSGGELGCEELPLCEGFEEAAPGGPPDASLWTIESPDCSGSGTLEVASDQAHTGQNSLRVDGGGGYCDHVFIANTSAMAEIGDLVYGRFFVRMTDPLGGGHVTFMTMQDAADNNTDLRMGGQNEILMWNRESDDATLPVLSPVGVATSVALDAGTWHCIEFKIDGPAGLLETWVDGQAIAGLEVDDTPTPDQDQQWHNQPGWAPSLSDFKLGWESYAGQNLVLWFDDVALSDAPIGCD